MKKGVFIVFIANVVNMGFGILIGFILPKYLSVSSYGYYKSYQLYINFVGILHLGFADGIYLKYGGKNIELVDKHIIQKEKSTLWIMQSLFTALVALISLLFDNSLMLLLAFSLLPINMISFYRNLFQATGEFASYGTILSVLPLITFIGEIILILIDVDTYVPYVLVVLFSNIVVYLFLEYKEKSLFGKTVLKFDVELLRLNIKSGFTLMLGNFASVFITSIDRLFIKILMNIEDFSYYSFAVSIENLFNTCVSAVSVTMYNYLCKTKDNYTIIKVKSYCIIASLFLIAIAFPVKYIVLSWIIKYVESINIFFVLMAAHAFYFVIKTIYINIYKANGKQKNYLVQMIIILCIAFIANIFVYFVISDKRESFAWATLFTAFVWFVICNIRDKAICSTFREYLLMAVSIPIFLICGIIINSAIFGFVVYITFLFLICLIFEKKRFLELIKLVIQFKKKK